MRSFGVAVARSVAPSFHRSVARILVRYAPRMARLLASRWGAFYEDGEAKIQPSTSPVGGISKEDGMGRQSHRPQGGSNLRAAAEMDYVDVHVVASTASPLLM